MPGASTSVYMAVRAESHKVRLPQIALLRNPLCQACQLHVGVRNVCVMGTGPVPAKVMIVGDAPGAVEDRSALPFVGPSGALLWDVLREIGLDPFITNVCKCRPPGNRPSKGSEMDACIPLYLEQELSHVNPKVIVTLGLPPASEFIRDARPINGRLFRVTRIDKSYWILPTYHPSYLLSKALSKKLDFKQHLQLAKDFAETAE